MAKVRTADKIIKENLALPDKYKNLGVIKMLEKQEKLIKEFQTLGHTRDDFFAMAREALLNKNQVRSILM